MARWDAAAIPRLAALFFAGVHVLLAVEIAGVAATSYAPGERPLWLFAIGATMAAIVAFFPFAVSRELLRRREWGRYWFSRWASIELVLGLSLLGLVHPSPDIPEGSEWLLILNVIVAAPAYGAKIWLRRRMAEPDVRELLL